MPGLGPGIHEATAHRLVVDGRVKPNHDAASSRRASTPPHANAYEKEKPGGHGDIGSPILKLHKRAGFPGPRVGDLVGFHTAHFDGGANRSATCSGITLFCATSKRQRGHSPSPACQHATGLSARRARFTAARLWGARATLAKAPRVSGVGTPRRGRRSPPRSRTSRETPSWRRGRRGM
ncbi:MAG: hypothetical protein QOH65_1931 [Methylobacteriaceae bacterium]|jgi:hypothetical protein|nr:hypothetical protein [Methylobacteriaceae bacterium]